MPAIESPRIWTQDIVAAHQAALAEREPLFVPVSPYADDRGWSIMNQLQGVLRPEGQINYTVQYPHVIKAWHRHQQQTDFWLCVQGHIKIGIYREADNRRWSLVTGAKRHGVLIIPPTLWHGATAVGGEPAALIYYVTHAFNAQSPDEQRRPHDSIPDFPWEVQHR